MEWRPRGVEVAKRAIREAEAAQVSWGVAEVAQGSNWGEGGVYRVVREVAEVALGSKGAEEEERSC